ncbi:hypothetical protein BD324DRAFT_605342 [Kockovaella imperatae]|uniref:Protein OS-9 homolog n=1 Tax=Kockovaella imperatae TaxID=4999 RepID=A0A1Y1U7J2_9TREE|nr:hypothetical protein BD324DRAFT_605342 [Kockovaella imperatae]ORX33983.1 hypothetical protein BD324DRAFT_605342 [Kockovaella imperatae]
MRNLVIYLSALTALSSHAYKHEAAQLRDLLAYPKYEIQFLNDLPISWSDADRVEKEGLERAEEWSELRLKERKELGDGSDVPLKDRLEIIPMTFTPAGSDSAAEYLCLLPPKNVTSAQTLRLKSESHEELDPAQSWAAMSHLDGKCLYSTLGWFTYSYCHNSHIRQFRAARHTHPHPPGGYEPEEDTSYEAYTLGQKGSRRPSRAAAESNAVSFGLGASSRYLVQRWSDGTLCDKTKRPREVEVQIHCSMTTTDIIYLVKEMTTCQYVVVIHSPHLCSLPGFRAPQVDVEPAGIQCRQSISDQDFESWFSSPKEEREGRLMLPGDRREAEKVMEEKKMPIDGLASLDDKALMSLFEGAIKALQSDNVADMTDDEEVMYLALVEDAEGNVVIETSNEMNQIKEADKMLEVVKGFLEQKRKPAREEEEEDKDGQQADDHVRDEL